MKKLFFAMLLIISVLSCKDRDDNPQETITDIDLVIKDFIWKGLNQYYLWQSDVENLADTRFASSVEKTNFSNENYVNFLKSFSDNTDFFTNLLNKPRKLYTTGYIDRFSWIVDNYEELEKSFEGTSLSSGMEFMLSRYGDNDGVLGIVRYVVPESSAEKNGVKRGDVFLSIDGVKMDLNNYSSLLYNNKTEMTIDINHIERIGGKATIISENRSISITKVEITENPVFIKKVFEKGSKKIGYLMYNAFTANFDVDLNNAFAEFKNQGVTDFVLDLRYNGGGRISSAVHLASMIMGKDAKGKLFAKERWNSKIHPYMESRDLTDIFLTDILVTDKKGNYDINHLNMSKLYVLTSKATASASELVINGLKPYIEVVQIGEYTTGKNVGSITLYDYIDNNKTKNPKHKWAMQPLTIKMENAQGVGDYTNGLPPTHELSEDVANMGILGDENEPLLAKALQLITGNTGKYAPQKPLMPVSLLLHSKSFNIGANQMYQ